MDTNVKINCETSGFEEANRMSIIINGMNMPKGNSTKNLLIYSDGKVFTGHKDDANYSAEERKTGEWVRNFDGNEWYWFCSNCKEEWYEEDLWMGGNDFPNFCPNCGADMRGEHDK